MTVNMDTKSIYVLSVVEALCVAMEDHETGVSHVKERVCVTTCHDSTGGDCVA